MLVRDRYDPWRHRADTLPRTARAYRDLCPREGPWPGRPTPGRPEGRRPSQPSGGRGKGAVPDRLGPMRNTTGPSFDEQSQTGSEPCNRLRSSDVHVGFVFRLRSMDSSFRAWRRPARLGWADLCISRPSRRLGGRGRQAPPRPAPVCGVGLGGRWLCLEPLRQLRRSGRRREPRPAAPRCRACAYRAWPASRGASLPGRRPRRSPTARSELPASRGRSGP